jgi:hypothetical protein
MEHEEFLVKVLFFKRVMKCIKDHQCSLCARTILTGSSYFLSIETDHQTGYFLKYCEQCLNEKLETPLPQTAEKGLDK